MFKISHLIVLVFFFHIPTIIAAQSWFWIGFTDKAGTQVSVSKPEEFLSERAIARRVRQNIPIDETDLPVSRVYIDSIIATGARFVHSSKWLNGITVKADHDSLTSVWKDFKFVSEVELTKPIIPGTKKAINKLGWIESEAAIDTSFYGASVHQVSQLNGQYFHQKGVKGQGMVIAVLDAGFFDADKLPSLSHLFESGRILGHRDFVNFGSDIYSEHSHGMMVLSTMGGYLPGELIGTAPEASYWILRTEDASTEYLIEEDNWVAGAEFADSVGADIINSSLGYYEFDDPNMNHTYTDMDGKTTRVTRGANMAAQKGMLVFSSAGNEARNSWKYIIAPSDGDHVIAVGAVDRNRNYASFSSIGPASDGDIKPNLAAMGLSSAVQGTAGSIVLRNGTSFASPILAGMAACLWQANPTIAASEIARVMMISAHQVLKPDIFLGYGIPDMHLAHIILNQYNVPVSGNIQNWKIFPNPFYSELTILSNSTINGLVDIEVVSLSGLTLLKDRSEAGYYMRTSRFNQLPAGMYLFRISGDTFSETHRVIKAR